MTRAKFIVWFWSTVMLCKSLLSPGFCEWLNYMCVLHMYEMMITWRGGIYEMMITWRGGDHFFSLY